MKPPQELYKRILESNRRWVEKKKAEDSTFFERLSREQSPEILFIGCSDSRVPANVIMGVEPGEVFVHRNVANLVCNTDMNAQSVIQYAVEHLSVSHVVVCGHYGCGGVNAAMRSEDLGHLNGWLREIRDVYRIHADELEAIQDERARYRRLVELNVEEQCMNVVKTAWVQQSYRAKGYPIVHGWCFALEDGLIRDLEIPFESLLDNIRKIYHLD